MLDSVLEMTEQTPMLLLILKSATVGPSKSSKAKKGRKLLLKILGFYDPEFVKEQQDVYIIVYFSCLKYIIIFKASNALQGIFDTGIKVLGCSHRKKKKKKN